MTDDDIMLVYDEIEGCCSDADRERIVAECRRGREAIQLLHDLVSECSSLALQWEALSLIGDGREGAEAATYGDSAAALREAVKRVLAKQAGMVGGEDE